MTHPPPPSPPTRPRAPSPTRARLMGRMDNLLLERSRAGPAGAGAAAAVAGGVGSQSRNARRSALTALRGMDLVKVAIKQVGRGCPSSVCVRACGRVVGA